MESARRAEKELGAEIVIIKKTSTEYGQMKDPLPCPSVVVCGRLLEPTPTLFGAGVVNFDDMKAALSSCGEQ